MLNKHLVKLFFTSLITVVVILTVGFVSPTTYQILKWVVYSAATIFALFLAFVAMRPSKYRVERSANVAAPAPLVFEQVNDFRKWEAWSPWANFGPSFQVSFEGPPAGEGSVFRWSGNENAVVGQMTISESQPYKLIRIRLDFVRPYDATSIVAFEFRPEGGQTAVTWTIVGKHKFLGKLTSLLMPTEKHIGGDFETGLAELKAVSESAAIA
jgi:hypothetical protein